MTAPEAAHGLGSNTLSGVTFSTLGYTHRACRRPKGSSQHRRGARAVARRGRRARHDPRPRALQPLRDAPVNTADQAVALIERIGEPALMIHLDTYHMNIEEKGFRSGVLKAGRHLKYIHLSESDRGVPGTGTVDFAATMAAFAEIGFQGDIVGEAFINMPPALAKALSVWRPVAKSAEEVLDPGMTMLKRLAVEHGLVAA
ncbi:MAG: sugar phosphate isomerase/epimerase [Geminicoccaceae bacterium]